MAVSQSNVPLPGYPQPIGAKQQFIWDHIGPSSYANIGTSSGKGDIINASDIGMGGFDSFNIAIPWGGVYGYTESGNYIVKIFNTSVTTTPSVSYANGAAIPTIRLQWFTTSSAFGAISTEATNTTDLSAEVIRFEAVCV